jgi:hypothetical protein
LPEIIRQIADDRIIRGVAELLQHRGEVFSRQQILRRPRGQAAPGQKHAAGGSHIVTRLRQQHGVAQRHLVLDATGLLCRHRGGGKRQSLPPGTGPWLPAVNQRIERADGGTSGERYVLKTVRSKALCVLHSTAQPSRQPDRRGNYNGSQHRGIVPRERFRPQNHRRQDESSRRFRQ